MVLSGGTIWEGRMWDRDYWILGEEQERKILWALEGIRTRVREYKEMKESYASIELG